MTPDEKWQKARMKCLLEHPFWSYLMLQLKVKKTEEIETAAVDGVTLFWNPKFIDTLTVDETFTVLVHELTHLVWLHVFRRHSRDPYRWNVACDYCINLWMNELSTSNNQKIFTFPKIGCLMDPKYKGMTAEEIYSKLPEQKKMVLMGAVMDSPQSGKDKSKGSGEKDGGNGKNGDKEIKEAFSGETTLEQQWVMNVTSAHIQAKMQGNCPGQIDKLVEEMNNPPRNWRAILREFITCQCKDDYSFKNPNPRYLHTGFCLPSLHSQRLASIAVAIDVSGSINQEMLNEFMGEVENIIAETRPKSIIIISCDAAVTHKQEYEPGDELPRKFKGGGGTIFTPVYKALEGEDIACLLFFTDLYGTFPDEQERGSFPTFWVTETRNVPVPFGTIIELKED